MSKPTIEAGHFHEVYLLKEQPAAYYRTIADRNRKLLAEATTPRLKQYLGEISPGAKGWLERLRLCKY